MIVLMRKAPVMTKSIKDSGRVSHRLYFLVSFADWLQVKVVPTAIRDGPSLSSRARRRGESVG